MRRSGRCSPPRRSWRHVNHAGEEYHEEDYGDFDDDAQFGVLFQSVGIKTRNDEALEAKYPSEAVAVGAGQKRVRTFRRIRRRVFAG